MSGGTALVWRLDRCRVNRELVDLAVLTDDDRITLHDLVRRHLAETGSAIAQRLLDDWPAAVEEFTAVIPRDYQRVSQIVRAAETAGRDVDEAVMAALVSPVAVSASEAQPTQEVARMSDPNGFLRHGRRLPARRPVPVRISDWREVYPPADAELIREQASRCMDCGIPFCHDGCPLGNRIPDWNDLVRTGAWARAIESLHATNNFPELTGRLCPAPCEAACVLGIGDDPVTIKQVEVEIINKAFELGLVAPQAVPASSGQRVAVIGSGPAGLAAAQQLARAGHTVTVYERDDAIGGLLRYGIPDFKLEKAHLDRRLAQLTAEGVRFRTGVNVGVDITAEQLRSEYDAVLLACGALAGRDTPQTPGRALRGIHQAMDHLVAANRAVAAATAEVGQASVRAGTNPIDAAGKHVVIIGGGDTAADCLGVAHRQGAAGVHQLDLYPAPPRDRDETRDPWPTWPWILREYPAHEEGGERVFAVAVREFVDDGTGQVRAVRIGEVTVTEAGRAADRDTGARVGAGASGRPGAAGHRLRGHRAAAAARPVRRTARPARRDRRPAGLADRCGRRLRRRGHAPGRFADRLGDRRGPGRSRGDPRATSAGSVSCPPRCRRPRSHSTSADAIRRPPVRADRRWVNSRDRLDSPL